MSAAEMAQKRHRGRIPAISALVVLLAVVGLVVGTAVLDGSSGDGLTEQEQAHAITQLEFDTVQEGATTRQALVDELGPPTDEQGLLRRGWVRPDEFAGICTGTRPEMVAYFALTTDYDAVWYGFCFDGDTLRWKSMYSYGD